NIGDIDSLIVNLADVQRLLDRMLKQNRGNIDATLRSLNSILGALVSNRRALENTLCTLPAGVSPYMQTTSWGEWFNVRIVTVVFKDQNGKVISQASEDRAGKAQPPYTECGKFGTIVSGGGGSGGGGGDDDDDGGDAVGLGSPPGSFGEFVGSVMGGSGA
ncbi:MAG TPA: hypothetical protein VF660_02870, partial [Actinomycetota bacterium]